MLPVSCASSDGPRRPESCFYRPHIKIFSDLLDRPEDALLTARKIVFSFYLNEISMNNSSSDMMERNFLSRRFSVLDEDLVGSDWLGEFRLPLCDLVPNSHLHMTVPLSPKQQVRNRKIFNFSNHRI